MAQFEKKGALSIPKNAVHRERDGEAATRPPLLVAVNFVAAARSWGGQMFVLYRTKLSLCRGNSALHDGFEAVGFEVVARIRGGLRVGVGTDLNAKILVRAGGDDEGGKFL